MTARTNIPIKACSSNRHGASVAPNHESACASRFPDETTSHSTRLPNNSNQVAGYHPILPPEGNPHPIPLVKLLANPLVKQLAIPLSNQKTVAKWLVIPKGEGSIALSPYGGKMDRGLGENEALRDFYDKVIDARASCGQVPEYSSC